MAVSRRQRASVYQFERRKRIALVFLTVLAGALAVANLGVYLWAIESDQTRLAVFIQAFEFGLILFTVFLGVLLASPSFKSLKAQYE